MQIMCCARVNLPHCYVVQGYCDLVVSEVSSSAHKELLMGRPDTHPMSPRPKIFEGAFVGAGVVVVVVVGTP